MNYRSPKRRKRRIPAMQIESYQNGIAINGVFFTVGFLKELSETFGKRPLNVAIRHSDSGYCFQGSGMIPPSKEHPEIDGWASAVDESGTFRWWRKLPNEWTALVFDSPRGYAIMAQNAEQQRIDPALPLYSDLQTAKSEALRLALAE